MLLLWETGNHKPLVVMAGQMLVPRNQRAPLQTHSPFCGGADHRTAREANFLADSSSNVQQKALHLKAAQLSGFIPQLEQKNFSALVLLPAGLGTACNYGTGGKSATEGEAGNADLEKFSRYKTDKLDG